MNSLMIQMVKLTLIFKKFLFACLLACLLARQLFRFTKRILIKKVNIIYLSHIII